MAQTANAAALTAGKPRRKKMLRLIIGAAILVVLVGAGWFIKAQSKKRAEAGAVKTAPVTKGTIVQKISSTGAVTAETGAQVKIGSQITGRIKHLYADVGSQVQANQVIAELDAPDLKANLEAAQRSYAQAESRYQQQLAGVQMQHTQVSSALEQSGEALTSARARAQQARSANGAALSRLKSAFSGLQGAQARQRSAEARLRSTQAAAALQATQGSSDVARAKSALSTAQASLTETHKSSDVSVANAVTALKQAQANASLAATNLKRQEGLLAKGFVAPSEVDTARTNRDNTAQVSEAAQNSLEATRAQAIAQVQAAKDGVDQAKAALDIALAGSYTSAMRTEDVRAAEADLDSARTGVTQAEMSVETARADVTSARSQVTSADSDVRSARAAQQTALGNLTQDRLKQQDVKTAFEAMQQARAQVAFQEAQYAKSYIRTPISGTVISLAQQEGETVAAGLSAPELIQVAALDRLEVIAYVDETDIGKLRLGQDAEITVDAFPKRKFAGKVYKISSAATMQQNVVTYACSIHLDKYRVGMLKPQMTTDVQIILEKADNLLLVPNEALKQTRDGAGGGGRNGAAGGSSRGPGGGAGGPSGGARGGAAGGPRGGTGGGGPGGAAGGRSGAGPGAGREGGPGGRQIVTQVVTLTGDKAELKEITTGRTDGSFTEVVSGLKEGDTVVLAGFEKLGIEGLSSGAGLPRFMMNRTPFGTAPSGGGRGGPGGGGGGR